MTLTSIRRFPITSCRGGELAIHLFMAGGNRNRHVYAGSRRKLNHKSRMHHSSLQLACEMSFSSIPKPWRECGSSVTITDPNETLPSVGEQRY